jgi:anaerobic dimethyl sulfoxide reductase subunit B
MPSQLGFYIDQSRCTGCKTCQVACKDKNDLEVGRLFRRVTVMTCGSFTPLGNAYSQNVVAYWTSMACNHCDNPKCVENCPTGAMHKRVADGIVLVNEDLCIGCQLCTWSCPYDAPQYNSQKGKMSKCDLCIDLIEEGEIPVCVAACPNQLIEFGQIETLRKQYGDLAEVKGLPPSEVTQPNIVIKPHNGAE